MNSFFLQGLHHPFITPAHLITLIALGILLGQQAKRNGYSALLIFIAFALASLVSTRFYRTDIHAEIMLLTLAGSIGILTTLKLPLPNWVTLIFAIIVGSLIGIDSASVVIPGLKVSKIHADMAGTFVSVSLILLLICLLSQFINKLWDGITLRIIGSWVFASALMVLALMLAPLGYQLKAGQSVIQSLTENINFIA